jgi:hypothetical protein
MTYSFDNVNLRTKTFSILVLFLLILPGIVMPVLNRPEKEVAGVSDSPLIDGLNSSSSLASQNNGFKFPEIKFPDTNIQAFAPTLPNFNSSISPKVIESQPVANQATLPDIVVRVDNNFGNDIRQRIQDQQGPATVQVQTGKIVWEAGLGEDIFSDKFPVGSKVNFKVGNKSQNLIITDNRILPVNTLMIISKEKFANLFADPEKQKEVDATGEKL